MPDPSSKNHSLFDFFFAYTNYEHFPEKVFHMDCRRRQIENLSATFNVTLLTWNWQAAWQAHNLTTHKATSERQQKSKCSCQGHPIHCHWPQHNHTSHPCRIRQPLVASFCNVGTPTCQKHSSGWVGAYAPNIKSAECFDADQGIVATFPMELGGKIVWIEVEIVDILLYYNILLGWSWF